MRINTRAFNVALIAIFALSLVFAGASFAADKCDPAACAAKCQSICKDSTLTQAERAELCKKVCEKEGGKACSTECKAKCEKACKAACEHGTNANATETGLIKTASATSGGCQHAKTTTASASDEKPEAEVKAASAKAGCAATCGAEAAKACAATKKACAMAEKEKEKPE